MQVQDFHLKLYAVNFIKFYVLSWIPGTFRFLQIKFGYKEYQNP